jgi:endo-1,4-beta-xylanase
LNGPTRRSVLAGALATAGVGLARVTARAEGDEEKPLRDIARARGIVYGSTIMASQLLAGDSFTNLLTREVAAIVPENEMKWSHMSAAPDLEDYRASDIIVDFARDHRLLCRGHNLLWVWRTPGWFQALPDRDASLAAMLRRIADMAGRYRGRIDSWDVVNEPVNPADGRADALRVAVFLNRIGPDYLDIAHRAARAADPKARLVLNEYDVEYDTPDMDVKRAAVLRACERMLKAGTPLDALGIEAHLSVGRHPFAAKKLRDYLAEAAGMGLEIQITELDCTDELAPADIAARDRLVADEYRRFLDVALDEKAVKMVMSWGLSDRYSWIVRHETNGEKQRRDGTAERPLPFDRDLRSKPARTALAQAFANAPLREMSADRTNPA